MSAWEGPEVSTPNPYDEPNTCVCSAWYEGECGCGGFVDYGKKLAWDKGYAAAMKDMNEQSKETGAGTPPR